MPPAETALSQGRILGLAPRRARLAPGWRVALWGILAVGLLILADAALSESRWDDGETSPLQLALLAEGDRQDRKSVV